MAAPRASDRPEVQQHYAAQFALSAAVAAQMRKLWPSLDPERLAATVPTLVRGGVAVGGQAASAAIAVAADYYEDLRFESIPGRFQVPVIDAPTSRTVESALDRATADMLAQIPSLVDELYLAEITTQIQSSADAALQELIADAAIDELFTSMESDREALGWARVTRADACAFCRMLATRGPVYLTERSANFRAHVPINGRGGVCKCQVEPLFGKHYEAPAHIRSDMAVWERVTADAPMGEAFNEFRRAIEGRSDGPRRRRRKGGADVSGPREEPQRLGFEYLTPAQLRHHLSILENLPDSDYRTGQMKRIHDRLAVIGA